MKYKHSVFNYIQKKNKYVLIYNTLYNSLVRLTLEEYEDYKNLYSLNNNLEKDFISNGLWIDKSLDEKQRYLACSQAYTLYMPRPLSITITTTLKCNARCTYCYENGVSQIDIYENAEEEIVDFIKKHLETNEVNITWFGGEPLLNVNFIDKLTNRLLEEKIQFSSYIITNGSLLSDEIVNDKLQFWNVKNIQITLDGTEKEYIKRKRYINPSEGEFYKILNNISKVALKGIFVNIRLNIDTQNKLDILKLLKEIDKIYSKYENVVFYPAFITGTSNVLAEEEKITYVKEMLLTMKNIKKLTAGTKFYSLPRMHACMNGNPKSFSIDVNGNIYTCEHHVGIENHKIGNINFEENLNDSRGRNIVFREECDKCVFLPKCYGGCESNYLEGDSPCMIEKYLIKAYLEIL